MSFTFYDTNLFPFPEAIPDSVTSWAQEAFSS